jgi:hypothetical protein
LSLLRLKRHIRFELLFGDRADLTAYLPARRSGRVDVRVGRARPDSGDHRSKVPRHELLGGCRSGDDIGRRDRPRHGALLRARRRKTCRIRIGRRLAQEDDDTAVHAQLANMDVRLRHGRLKPAIRLRILDDPTVWGDRSLATIAVRAAKNSFSLTPASRNACLLSFVRWLWSKSDRCYARLATIFKFRKWTKLRHYQSMRTVDDSSPAV